MTLEVPNSNNPFVGQSPELAMAWELGWYKCREDAQKILQEGNTWAIDFRRKIRNAIFPFYPNNPCTTDEELEEAVLHLVGRYSRSKRTQSK